MNTKTTGIMHTLALRVACALATLTLLAGAAALPAAAETLGTNGSGTILLDTSYATPEPSSQPTSTPTTTTTATPTASPTPAPSNASVYVVAETVTDANGAEISTVKWGDKVNIILRVVDYSSAKFNVTAGEISARVNSSVFTYTGNGEISQLVDAQDDSGEYYTYVLLFRDVIYNGGGTSFPINLSYLDSNLEMQQFSVSIGQCVDKDPNDPANATTPALVVRQSSYGNSSLFAGTPFALNVTAYATSGTESLNDVIVSVTLPEGITLSGGSLSSYVGAMSPKSTRDVGFSILPASSFDKGVANITVNLTGTGALTGKAITGQTIISVPIGQPDRFELGTLELPDSLMAGTPATITLNFVNKGKNPVSNVEGVISGSNFVSETSDQYLGNLAAGSTNSIDFDITPDAEGSVSGVITIHYEASDGSAKAATKDFSLPVGAAMDMGDMGFDDFAPVEPTGFTMPIWGWGLIAIGALAVVAVLITLIRKHLKKANLAKLEDEDEDDFGNAPSAGDNGKGSNHEDI